MRWKWKKVGSDGDYFELWHGNLVVARIWFWGDGLWVGEILDPLGSVVRVITGRTELGLKRRVGRILS